MRKKLRSSSEMSSVERIVASCSRTLAHREVAFVALVLEASNSAISLFLAKVCALYSGKGLIDMAVVKGDVISRDYVC